MAMSLEDLLAKEGFKGRSSKTMSRTASGPVGGSIPIYLPRGQHKSSSSSNLRKTERRNSDRALYDLKGGSPTINRGTDIKPRDNFIRREKTDKGTNIGSREKFEKRNYLDMRDASKSSVDSSGHFSSNEIVEVQQGNGRAKASTKDNGKYKEIYLNEAYSPSLTKGKSSETANKERDGRNSRKDIPTVKRHGSFSNKILIEHKISSDTSDKGRKEPDPSSSKSNKISQKNKSFNESRSLKRVEVEQSLSEPPLDEAAIKALISILSGYIKQFLKDGDFRASLHHNTFASLNLSELEESLSESKVIVNLEQAIETVERSSEELTSAKELKKASLQLSVITGLNANELEDGSTSGIPNSKLSACGHLYLSVIYKLQKKDRISAKHLLQVFCDSPFQARTMLLPELWEYIFHPHLSHLEVWYTQESNFLVDSPSKTRKLKQLKKVYDDILDSGTYQFSAYYKDWLTEGVDAPSIPSINIPSISFQTIQHREVNSQFSDSGNPLNQFSPQPMVSKKLYESVFGRVYKQEAVKIEDHLGTDDIDNTIESPHGSVVEDKRTLTYSLEVVKNTNLANDRNGKFSAQDGIISEEGQRLYRSNGQGESDQKANIGNSLIWEEDSTNGQALDELPSRKINELTLMRLAKSVFEMQQARGSTDLIDTFLPRYDDAPYPEFSPSETKSVGEDKFVDGACFFPSIPQDYICPLTGVLFNDPVTLETGETYERAAITEWFNKGNNLCPVTGKELERQSVPFTNFILKRIIHGWKLEHCRNILASASQMGRTFGEQKYKDEAAVCILDHLLTVYGEEEKIVNANLLIALGGLQFLVRRFKDGDMDEKTRVAMLLACCIEADSGCRKDVARNIDKCCLLELLQCKQVKARTNAVLLLSELICLSRMTESKFFLNGFEKEDVVSAMHVLLVFLQSSPPEQRPSVAVLLLQLDLLGEPLKYSIYREEAVNAITEALDNSFSNEKVRETCCRALLILGRRISFSGKIMTEDWILKQAGFLDGPVSEILEIEDEKAIVSEDSLLDAGEEEAIKDWLMKVSTSLLGEGKKSFLNTLSTCLGSGDFDLARVCLTTVAWLSSALLSLADTEFQLSAFSALISQLKENLENGLQVEHKILASMSLLNFTRIPECRVLLMKMSEEMTVPLQRLSEVTWTAKELYTIISQEDQ